MGKPCGASSDAPVPKSGLLTRLVRPPVPLLSWHFPVFLIPVYPNIEIAFRLFIDV